MKTLMAFALGLAVATAFSVFAKEPVGPEWHWTVTCDGCILREQPGGAEETTTLGMMMFGRNDATGNMDAIHLTKDGLVRAHCE